MWPDGDWFLDPWTPADLVAYRKEKVLVQGQTRFQSYEIFENQVWGRILVLDGRLQSAQQDEFIYHEALVHPALIAHPAPRRVLVLGGGEGSTLREVLRHPTVEQAVMVDLDEELVEVCRQWLPSFHLGALVDPRVRLVFDEGRAFLAGQPPGSFEVIILDLPEPLEEGPALRLFTRQMCELVQTRLAPGGLAACQSGSAGPQGRLLPDLYATFRAVFPRVVPYGAYIPSFMDFYGFLVAGGEDFIWPAPAEVAGRLKARQVAGLKWFGAEFSQGLPWLPPYLAEHLNQGRVLTDAQPFRIPSGGGSG